MAQPLSQRFILDVHLGKLARHLRMLGFDSLWPGEPGDERSSAQSDDELLRISREENRILLTRDRELQNRADPVLSHYVLATDPEKQLLEVIRHFELGAKVQSGKGFLTICLQCNRQILPVKAHQLEDRLPGNVRLEFKEFFLCPRCERVYWKGSHFDRMLERVQKLLSELNAPGARDPNCG